MNALLDISIHTRDAAESEVGHSIGQFVTRSNYRNWGDRPFGIDNNCFNPSTFKPDRYLRLLNKHRPHRNRCLFVPAPDVVGSARRTMEVFRLWYPKLHGWPIALVAQDGAEDLDIPWNLLSAIFIGGTDKFKNSTSAIHVGQAAKLLGKHWHVGRVNTPDRWDRFEAAGADTCDGSGIRMYSHMREQIARRNENRLFDCGVAAGATG